MIARDTAHVIVRAPADCFRHAISSHPDRALIRPELAQAQHRVYRELLATLGLRLAVLPPDEGRPDSCFTQDLAIVLNGRALLARPRHPARRGELDGISGPLRSLVHDVQHVRGPATLEGGDVLRIGGRIVVGSSARTNEAGIRTLTEFAEALGYDVRVAEVPPGALHLQTGVTALGEALVLGRRDLVEQRAFEGLDRIVVSDKEPDACNVLTVGTDVVASGRYHAHAALEPLGFRVHALDLSEFVRADGGPTCLVLEVPGID